MSLVAETASSIVALGRPVTAKELSRKLHVRPVEIHRAVAHLEREGYEVQAIRGPARPGRPGRRPFLYSITKAPTVHPIRVEIVGPEGSGLAAVGNRVAQALKSIGHPVEVTTRAPKGRKLH